MAPILGHVGISPAMLFILKNNKKRSPHKVLPFPAS
jgi:hypothetical protein